MDLPPDIIKSIYFDRDAVKRLGSSAKPWLVRCDGEVYRCRSWMLMGFISSSFDLEAPLTPKGPCAWLGTLAPLTLEDAELT
jgi:hypothetical protein